MAELLKNRYNDSFFESMLSHLSQFADLPAKEKCLSDIHGTDWDTLELKPRMKRISQSMALWLPNDYQKATDIILKLSSHLLEIGATDQGLEYMFLPEYIEAYGQSSPARSMEVMNELTKFVTCEFAIRPFIDQDQKFAFEHLYHWAEDDHHCVRRLSSEGCRPLLPWAMRLKALQKDPTPILPILEELKEDESDFVRRSVANNLNDLSKDHDQLVLSMTKKWLKKDHEHTNWIVKHALRTLLKKGNNDALALFGYGPNPHFKVDHFKIIESSIKVGGDLNFEFEFHNESKGTEKFRLEYIIYYLLKNGGYGKKVFKLKEATIEPSAKLSIKKRHSFKPISTRTYYHGQQKLSMLINGKETDALPFYLEA